MYAGVGGAAHVTTVDVGRAALATADANWALNGLPPQQHVAAAEDAFAFLERAARERERCGGRLVVARTRGRMFCVRAC